MNELQKKTFRIKCKKAGDCLIYPTVNTNIDGIKSRPHRVYFYLEYDRWPGRLEKTCSTPKCILHYQEKEQIDPDDMVDYSWGSNKRYAQAYGVSEAYISRLRNAD